MDEEEWAEMEDRIKDEKAEAAPSDMDIISAMEKHGGNFTHFLGRATRAADLSNRRKIKETFSEIWEQHRKMAIHDKRHEQR